MGGVRLKSLGQLRELPHWEECCLVGSQCPPGASVPAAVVCEERAGLQSVAALAEEPARPPQELGG